MRYKLCAKYEMGVKDEEENEEDEHQVDLEVKPQLDDIGEEDDIEQLHL
jgi:dihydroneopterin aldolase